MARGTAHLEGTAAKRDTIPVGEGQADVFSADDGGQADPTAGGLVHQPASGHVVGVGVGVDRRHQFDSQLANQGEIAAVLLKDRVDDHPLAAGHIGQQVGEGAGVAVKELAEQQRATAGSGREGQGGSGSDVHGVIDHQLL